MSRLGKIPVSIPSEVTVEFSDGYLIVVGPKGRLQKQVRTKDVSVDIVDAGVIFKPMNTSNSKALWGTYASHCRNMIEGVTVGFSKVLQIEGVGYRAEVNGSTLVLNMGYSHPVEIQIPEDLSVVVEKNIITVSGHDKEQVGQFSANVRAVRKPEPYKGKGIKYQGEYIIRKQGKKAV